MNPSHLFFLMAVCAVCMTAWIAAIASIGSVELRISGLLRGMWIAIVIIFPIVGPLLWFAWGRQYYLRTRPTLATE